MCKPRGSGSSGGYIRVQKSGCNQAQFSPQQLSHVDLVGLHVSLRIGLRVGLCAGLEAYLDVTPFSLCC